jgi:hypothetical protein
MVNDVLSYKPKEVTDGKLLMVSKEQTLTHEVVAIITK